MFTITAEDVNSALAQGLSLLLEEGTRHTSRNGPVLVAPRPVTTTYTNPRNHVLESATRDANPFFHAIEAAWMLAGSNRLQLLQFLNSRFAEYSDDSVSVWGAYGWRWRSFFGYDQLDWIVTELRSNPTSRRCVLAMWNPMDNAHATFLTGKENHPSDLYVATNGGRDVPCNTHAYFDIRNGALNMTVCCRSNDAVWGAYGANAVHFSVLLEYMAARIGVAVGTYYQISNNLHVYTDVFNEEKLRAILEESEAAAHRRKLIPSMSLPLFQEDLTDEECCNALQAELAVFFNNETLSERVPDFYVSNFMTGLVLPIARSFALWKKKDYEGAFSALYAVEHRDWYNACHDWLLRRQAKAEEKRAQKRGAK